MEKKEIVFTIIGHRIPEPWQKEVLDNVQRDYYDDAVKISEIYKKLVTQQLHTSDTVDVGNVIDRINKTIARYSYVKVRRESTDEQYLVKIDLLLHTLKFGHTYEELV